MGTELDDRSPLVDDMPSVLTVGDTSWTVAVTVWMTRPLSSPWGTRPGQSLCPFGQHTACPHSEEHGMDIRCDHVDDPLPVLTVGNTAWTVTVPVWTTCPLSP